MQNNFRPYLLTIAILIAFIVALQMCLPAGATMPSGCTSSVELMRIEQKRGGTMISVSETSPTEPLVITGEMVAGDKVPNRCCQGFDWEVMAVFPADTPEDISVWGKCHNPDCPDWQRVPTDMYRGVSHVSAGDLAEWLLAYSAS